MARMRPPDGVLWAYGTRRVKDEWIDVDDNDVGDLLALGWRLDDGDTQDTHDTVDVTIDPSAFEEDDDG